MKTETFDDPAAFLAAVQGKKRKNPRHNAPVDSREARRGTKGEGRANLLTRAAAGEGNRQKDLDKLASLGWRGTYYEAATDTHWLQHIDGRTTPRVPSYREALDTALKMEGLKK